MKSKALITCLTILLIGASFFKSLAQEPQHPSLFFTAQEIPAIKENPSGSHVFFTSGIDYHQAHNHSDENAFTFNAYGEAFAIDPGRFPIGTESHNTVLVNGRGEILNYGKGRILDYREMGSAVYVKGDARDAYAVALHFTHNKIEVDTTNLMVFSKAQRQLR